MPHAPEISPIVSDTFEYQLLRGHNRTDGSYKSDQQLRMEYIELTDGLIAQMTEGLAVTDSSTGEQSVETPDVVVWLDKSARPLSWLTRELWPRLAVDAKTGEIPTMPDFKFVNIDREQWVNTVDPEGVGQMDINRVDSSIIRSLRSIFVEPKYKQEGLNPAIDQAPSLLDDKTIMIVDEVYSSGRTLNYAQSFFAKAFPNSKIGGAYWMQGIAAKAGALGNKDLPVWYKADTVTGRGVGNRNDAVSGASGNLTQQLGRYFLSVPLKDFDHDALQLREEFHELAINPDVPIIPSRKRQMDRTERIEMYNNGLSLDAIAQKVRQIKAQR